MAEIKRVRRSPINGLKNKLKVQGQEPGYEYRIVNDLDGRVEDLTERGYEFVENKGVTVGDKRVATPSPTGSKVEVSMGGGVRGYLMRIKKEFFEEDQATKAKVVDDTEALLKAPNIDGKYGKIELKRS